MHNTPHPLIITSTPGEHVIDIDLTQMDSQAQKHLFRALLPRFARDELLLVARKVSTDVTSRCVLIRLFPLGAWDMRAWTLVGPL